jgi:hypothetical protein
MAGFQEKLGLDKILTIAIFRSQPGITDEEGSFDREELRHS